MALSLSTTCLELLMPRMVMLSYLHGTALTMCGLLSIGCMVITVNLFNTYSAANGANYTTTSEPLSRDYSFLYTSQQPVNVTDAYFTNEQVRNDIIDMYELFQAENKDMEVGEILDTIVKMSEGAFYLRVSTDYWKVTFNPSSILTSQIQLSSPYIDLKWTDTALPGH